MPPTYVIGELWDEIGKSSLLLVTTNSTVRNDGALVMGRGAALEAKERFPTFPFWLGEQMRHYPGGIYGVLWGYQDEQLRRSGTQLGAFQVKIHWRDDASLLVIAFSAGQLALLSQRHTRIAMNIAGTGNGRLNAHDVLPILEPLPPHVHIYTKEPLCL